MSISLPHTCMHAHTHLKLRAFSKLETRNTKSQTKPASPLCLAFLCIILRATLSASSLSWQTYRKKLHVVSICSSLSSVAAVAEL